MRDNSTKKDIRQLELDELTQFFAEHGHKPFRARQVFTWLWKKTAHAFDQMTDLSKDLRALLAEHFEIRPAKAHTTQLSTDGTIKTGFQLFDGNFTEGVLIPGGSRLTACVSSQVGCNLACTFCATGKLKMKRNLNADEIYDQVALINQQSIERRGRPLDNIVFMGMGEPLLNYNNVLQAIHWITSEEGLGISAKRITVSTAGVTRKIRQLADDGVKFNLAISLHAATDAKRSELMPINRSAPLAELSEAIRYFYEKTQTRITYEYLLLRDFNDSYEDARALANFCKVAPCKINLIEYNPIGDGRYDKSTDQRAQDFIDYLESKNLVVNLRKSKGEDIDAACGQLANKILEGNLQAAETPTP